jgi:hypothetical protein
LLDRALQGGERTERGSRRAVVHVVIAAMAAGGGGGSGSGVLFALLQVIEDIAKGGALRQPASHDDGALRGAEVCKCVLKAAEAGGRVDRGRVRHSGVPRHVPGAALAGPLGHGGDLTKGIIREGLGPEPAGKKAQPSVLMYA